MPFQPTPTTTASRNAARVLIVLIVLFVLAALASLTSAPATAAEPRRDPPYPEFPFEFALVGDAPYDDAQETNYFPNVIAEINRSQAAFVVHDGDIKSGSTPCSDPLLERRFQLFQTFRPPTIYLFGDNEWTDCPRADDASPSPEEWLNRLRARFCAGDSSLGQRPMVLERQSRQQEYAAFRENVRWIHGGVLFVGLNVPGDANNFGRREFGPRNQANIAWLHDSFDLAAWNGIRAMMLVMQANPHFEMNRTNRARLGFNEMLTVIEEHTLAYDHPVVLVHGDSHYFRIDQPLVARRSGRRVENFTRVETYGNPDMHWLKASVDWRNPNVFAFERQLVRKNFIHH